MSSNPPNDSDILKDPQSTSLYHPSAPEKAPVPDLADQIRQEVEQEQALVDAQRKVRDLEGELGRLRSEKDGLEAEKGGATSTTNQLRTQLSTLQSSYHQANSELGVLQTRINAIEREKRELLEEIERLQQRSNRFTQELFTLRSQRTEASQKIAHLDVEVSELRMAAESSKFNEERSNQALQSARSEILNLGKSAADVEERFGRYRVAKQAELSQLQIDHEALVARVTRSENSYRSLQRAFDEQARRLAESHANIATLTTAAASKKASSSLEFQRLMDENRILERRGDEARSVIAEREAELERLSEAQAAQERQTQERVKKEEIRRREAERRADDLKVVVERLALATGEGSHLSSAAALANEMRDSGKSYTEFYHDYVLNEAKLQTAEHEIERLNGIVEEISRDIADKKPILDEQEAEYARAVERSQLLAIELERVRTSRDAHESNAKTSSAAAVKHEQEVFALQTSADDLSRQVQGLLRQIALRDDPSLASQILDGTGEVSGGDIVSDYLVEFKSIRNLQEQNVKLLKLTRSLSTQLDTREIRRATADQDDEDIATSLEQATETVNRLHNELLETQRRLLDSSRERDLFSKLLAKGEGLRWSNGSGGPIEDSDTPHHQAVESLQTEIQTLRIKAEAEIKEAKDLARSRGEAASVAEVEKIKLEAENTLLKQHQKMLDETSTLQKQEYGNLEAQVRHLQSALSQAQNGKQQADDQAATRQAEADRFRTELANVRAEKEQWKSTESRLQSDFRGVQTERIRLQQLIDNLNNVSSENEKTRVEERIRLEKRIEELHRESTTLRQQMEQARQAARAADQRVADAESRFESATSTLRTSKDAADALAQSRAEQIESLVAESAKNKAMGMNWRKRALELETLHKTLEESAQGKDQNLSGMKAQLDELQKERDDIRAKLADVERKLGDAEKRVGETDRKLSESEKKLSDTQRAENLKEGTVQRLQSELRQAQARSQLTVPASSAGMDQGAMHALQSERDSLQQRLNQAESDLAIARSGATATTTTAPAVTATTTTSTADEVAVQLQTKYDELFKEKTDLDERYSQGVVKVNRVNRGLQESVTALRTEKTSSDVRITELEQELANLRSQSTPVKETAGASSANTAPSQSAIDNAVEAAVAAKVAELNELHAKAMQEAQSPVTAVKAELTGPSQNAGESSNSDASIERRVKEAVGAQVAELEKERDELKAKVDELESKIKSLERLVKTAEMARKTLERQKTTLESQKADLESQLRPEGSSSTPSAEGATLSVQASEFKPTLPTKPSTPAGPSGATPSVPPSGPSAPSVALAAGVLQSAGSPTATTSTRGTVRGRSRATATRGRGGVPGRSAVLNAVNAAAKTTAPTSTPNPTSPTGTKRPLPEDGEISETPSVAGTDILQRIQGAAGGPRQIKRPRGGAPSGPRRASGADQGGLGGQTGQSGQGGQGGTTDGADGGATPAGEQGTADRTGGAGGASGDSAS